jgi:hypothetical protein
LGYDDVVRFVMALEKSALAATASLGTCIQSQEGVLIVAIDGCEYVVRSSFAVKGIHTFDSF